jgi:hypothetical protein
VHDGLDSELLLDLSSGKPMLAAVSVRKDRGTKREREHTSSKLSAFSASKSLGTGPDTISVMSAMLSIKSGDLAVIVVGLETAQKGVGTGAAGGGDMLLL